jgi:Tn3 transposase DDE domain
MKISLHLTGSVSEREVAARSITLTPPASPITSLLGFRFAPRIRDLADKRLYVSSRSNLYLALSGLIGGTINLKQISSQWAPPHLVAQARQLSPAKTVWPSPYVNWAASSEPCLCLNGCRTRR